MLGQIPIALERGEALARPQQIYIRFLFGDRQFAAIQYARMHRFEHSLQTFRLLLRHCREPSGAVRIDVERGDAKRDLIRFFTRRESGAASVFFCLRDRVSLWTIEYVALARASNAAGAEPSMLSGNPLL